MNDEQLQAIQARLLAATPGPWVMVGRKIYSLAPSGFLDSIVAEVEEVNGVPAADDSSLIANAPTDIAALIAEVRRLQAIVDDYDIRPDC